MNWYRKKLAYRGNIPKAWDIDERMRDPYRPRKDTLTMPGDEDISGGLGTRARGKDYPSDFSADSDMYDEQKKNDIPGEEVIMDLPAWEGIPAGALADPEDGISLNRQVMEDLSNPPPPVGPHNMQSARKKSPPSKRLSEDIFDYVRSNQKS